MDLRTLVRDVPDFPIPGILFRDITPLLGDAAAFRQILEELSEAAVALNAEAIVGIESRGFIFGAPLAARLALPFVPIRKPGKLPAALMSVEYALEYGEGRLDIHRDALAPGKRALIVDDLLATGGTGKAAGELVRGIGGAVAGFVFVVELEDLSGRYQLAPYPVVSLIRYA